MFLYTILTTEQVFPVEPIEMKTARVGNDFFEYYEQGEKAYLSRVISTDPKRFLDKKYSPSGELFI